MKHIESVKLRTLISTKGINPFNLVMFDAEYELPSDKFILGEFSQDLKHNLSVLGRSTWRMENNDCDNFARFAWTQAGLANVEKELAFGLLSFTTSYGVPHVINFWINSDLEIKFYEPQNQMEIKLTDDEIGTINDLVI